MEIQKENLDRFIVKFIELKSKDYRVDQLAYDI